MSIDDFKNTPDIIDSSNEWISNTEILKKPIKIQNIEAKQDIDTIVNDTSDKIYIVELYAQRCGPCKGIYKKEWDKETWSLVKAARSSELKNKDVSILRIDWESDVYTDVWKKTFPTLDKVFYPTMYFIQSGKVIVKKSTVMWPKEIKENVKKLSSVEGQWVFAKSQNPSLKTIEPLDSLTIKVELTEAAKLAKLEAFRLKLQSKLQTIQIEQDVVTDIEMTDFQKEILAQLDKITQQMEKIKNDIKQAQWSVWWDSAPESNSSEGADWETQDDVLSGSVVVQSVVDASSWAQVSSLSDVATANTSPDVLPASGIRPLKLAVFEDNKWTKIQAEWDEDRLKFKVSDWVSGNLTFYSAERIGPWRNQEEIRKR